MEKLTFQNKSNPLNFEIAHNPIWTKIIGPISQNILIKDLHKLIPKFIHS